MENLATQSSAVQRSLVAGMILFLCLCLASPSAFARSTPVTVQNDESNAVPVSVTNIGEIGNCGHHGDGDTKNTETGFLDLDGVSGTATSSNFKNQIVIKSFSYSLENAGDASGGGTPRTTQAVSFGDIKVVKDLDQSSPTLAVSSALGRAFADAVITLVDVNTGETRIIVTLDDVRVTSVSVGYEKGFSQPMEIVLLSFRKIKWEVGSVTAEFDLSQGTGG